MKTETEIAKENVEGCNEQFSNIKGFQVINFGIGLEDFNPQVVPNTEWVNCKRKVFCSNCEKKSKEHLASCQRFLAYLIKQRDLYKRESNIVVIWDENKEQDLQNAIKIYEEAGVK